MKEGIVMYENLSKEDKDLIKRCMLNQSVSITAEMLQCKEVVPKETYEKEMRDADRLIYLVNVLNGKTHYDKE